MATARNIELSTSDSGIYSAGVREDAARAASEVLQDDLEKHHIYFNNMGFHSKSNIRLHMHCSREALMLTSQIILFIIP
jgi:hypothetical protein